MKKISVIFAILAVLLSDIMCAVVAYNYCDIQWQIEYGGTSAPANIAFLYAIPYGIGVIVCAVLALIFWKRK